MRSFSPTVVYDVTSVVGAVTSEAVGLVTDILNGNTRTASPTTTSRRNDDDDYERTTVYATATVTASNAAARSVPVLGSAAFFGGGAAGLVLSLGMTAGALSLWL